MLGPRGETETRALIVVKTTGLSSIRRAGTHALYNVVVGRHRLVCSGRRPATFIPATRIQDAPREQTNFYKPHLLACKNGKQVWGGVTIDSTQLKLSVIAILVWDVRTLGFRLQNTRAIITHSVANAANRRPISIALSCRPSWVRFSSYNHFARGRSSVDSVPWKIPVTYYRRPLHSPTMTVWCPTNKRVVIVSYFSGENGVTVTVKSDRYINDFHQRLSRTETLEKAYQYTSFVVPTRWRTHHESFDYIGLRLALSARRTCRNATHFLGLHIKSSVYKRNPETPEDLKIR